LEEEGALALVAGNLGDESSKVTEELESNVVHWPEGFFYYRDKGVCLRELYVLPPPPLPRQTMPMSLADKTVPLCL